MPCISATSRLCASASSPAPGAKRPAAAMRTPRAGPRRTGEGTGWSDALEAPSLPSSATSESKPSIDGARGGACTAEPRKTVRQA
eukprot:scaffold45719_cov26-Tisochrysis_lutea.AAC.1